MTDVLNISASHIRQLLADRHISDVFVAECKDGSTWGGGHRRLDAWAMRRSWTNSCTFGYEIKVNRSDFLKDEKWEHYLPLCNQFYFVCPSKMIMASELPAEAGLLWVTQTGSRLYCKKKAPHRLIKAPENLYMYILMSRAIIKPPGLEEIPTHEEYWRAWLQKKREKQELGYGVSRRIHEIVQAAEDRAHIADAKVQMYECLRRELPKIGIDPDLPLSDWVVENKLRDLRRTIPARIERNINDVASAVKRLMENLKQEGD